jgi:hypothetical protein
VNEFARFPYYGITGKIFAKFMAFYNGRLGRIADRRYAAGKYGKRNLDQRYLVYEGFAPCKKAAFKVIIKGIFKWLLIELRSLFLPITPKKTTSSCASRGSMEPELTTDP